MELSHLLSPHLSIQFYSTFGLLDPCSVFFLPSTTAQIWIYTAQHTGAGKQEGYSHTQVTVNKVQIKSLAQRTHTFPQNLLTVHWGAIS